MYVLCSNIYKPCTYNVQTCTYKYIWKYIHVYVMYIHILTCSPIRFSWPTPRCRTQGYPSAFSCQGGRGWGQSLSRRWWFFLCKTRFSRNWGGHQQVYERLGKPGKILFWQPAFIAKQTACSCCHEWQHNVACCSFGRSLFSYHGWGTAEKVHAFGALIVQARSGIQVNEYYIIVYTMYIHAIHMYIHCLLKSTTLYCPDGHKKS